MRCRSMALHLIGTAEVQAGFLQKAYECRDCGEINAFDEKKPANRKKAR